MGQHQVPPRTRRRLIAAGTAAVALIGTTVTIGLLGNASARDARVVPAATEQCLPDVSSLTGGQTTTPPTSTESREGISPPAQPPDDQPSDTGTEAPPSEAGSTTPQTESGGYGAGPQGFRAQPPTIPPVPPVASDTPDERGAVPPTTPPDQPQAQAAETFTAAECTEQLGPFPRDFVNIRKVRPSSMDPRPARGASRGSFVSRCGTNENGHQNPDNFIVAPGKANGAHHLHDYVGNVSADAFSTNESLRAAGTTCRAGDRSTYFWPVLRVRERAATGARHEAGDAHGAGGSQADPVNPHNVGTVLRPTSVRLQFRGNPTAKVVAMPTFLRVITGDAKAATNGGAAGNAKWTCTGFPNRFTTKYPLCPRGSQVQRVLDFASCWDGANTDSANHRTHIVFPDKNGACPQGTRAVPQLRMTLTYAVPRGAVFAVDTFPEQLHSPLTDHGDFVNVMPEGLMNRVVTCVNSGRNC